MVKRLLSVFPGRFFSLGKWGAVNSLTDENTLEIPSGADFCLDANDKSESENLEEIKDNESSEFSSTLRIRINRLKCLRLRSYIFFTINLRG